VCALQEHGCYSSSEATRRAEPQCVQCASGEDAEAWAARIRAALGPRPRRVAVFVNPVGGTGRAMAVYRAEVRRRWFFGALCVAAGAGMHN
jgi:hypothetical protein